jgi:uncharacterized repeat protein (TIGR01451 family)
LDGSHLLPKCWNVALSPVFLSAMFLSPTPKNRRDRTSMRFLNFRTALLGATLALLSSVSGAVVTISTSVVGSPSYTPGSNVTVRVAVTDNSSGAVPAVAALRLQYNSETFSFVSATGQNADGYLGDIDGSSVGAEEPASGQLVTRDIPTVGNFGNTDGTPEIMDVTFVVRSTPVFPTSILADVDPGVSGGVNSFQSTAGSPISPRTFDNSGTSNIGPGGALSGVVVSSAVVGAPALNQGTSFDVQTVISDNTTTQVPSAAVLRVTYDATKVGFLSAAGSASDGFLGVVDSNAIGAEVPVGGGLVYRDIPTLGNFANTNLTPEIMTVSFEVLASDTTLASIGYDVAPGVSAGVNSLVDTESNPITPRTFNNAGTTDLLLNRDPSNPVYVALRGNDLTGDGSFARPYRTIQAGVNNAVGGSVNVIEGGVFTEAVVINKTLALRAADPNTTVTTNSADAVILVLGAPGVLIDGFGIEVPPTVLNGIAATDQFGPSNSFNNLVVQNNTIVTVGGPPEIPIQWPDPRSLGSLDISDDYSAVIAVSTGGTAEAITLSSNTVSAVEGAAQSFGYGFRVLGASNVIQNNRFERSAYRDVLTSGSESTSVTRNQIHGGGVEVVSPGSVMAVTDNTFNASLAGYAALTINAATRAEESGSYLVAGNTFRQFFTDVNLGASRGVVVNNNTFWGSSSAFAAHVVFDSGYETAVRPLPGNVTSASMILTNNTFNTSSIPGIGVLIKNSFGDLFTNEPPHSGSETIIEGNLFDFAEGEFFRLSNAPGEETTSSFTAALNSYRLASGVKDPAAMTSFADQNEINNRTYDIRDNSSIGEVIYNLPTIINNSDVQLQASVNLASPISSLASPQFTISLSNNGPESADGTTAVLTIPGFSGLLVGPPTLNNGAVVGSINVSGNEISLEASTLPANSEISVVVTGSALGAVGTYAATGSASIPTGDSVPSNNSFTLPYDIRPQTADVSLSATQDLASTFTTLASPLFTIVLANNGPDIADGTTAVLTIPGFGSLSSEGTTEADGASGSAVVSGSEVALTATTLPSGGSLTFRIRGNSPGTVGVYTASGEASGPGVDDDTSNNSAEVQYEITPQAVEVGLTGKLRSTSPFSTVASPVFEFELSNAGSDNANGTTAVLNIPGFSSLSLDGINDLGLVATITITGSQVEVTALNLPSGGTFAFAVIGNALGTPGSYVATGETGFPGVDSDLSNNSVEIPYVIETQADVSVVKSANPSTATLGTIFSYTVTVFNNGPNTATNVIVSDPLPGSTVLLSPTASQGTVSVTSSTLAVNLGSIDSGDSATVTYQLLPTRLGSVDNTAFVSTADSDADESNNSSAVSVAVLPASGTGNVDLAVTPSVFPVQGTTSQLVNVVLSVSNLGVGTETAASLYQLLPPSFEVVNISSDKGSATVDANNLVSMDIGAMSAGETVSVSVLVRPSQSGLFEAPVLVSGQVFDYNSSNNSDLSTFDIKNAVEATDLRLSKDSVDSTVNLGGRTTWTITLTNNGLYDATDVAIYDALPPGFVYENGQISGGIDGTLSVVGNRVTAYFPTVIVGETVTVDLSGRFTVAGEITNEVLVSSSEDSVEGGRQASATLDVVIPPAASADLAVTKSVDKETVVQDGEVVFTMTVTNNGPSTATNMLLADPIPAGFEIVSAFANVGAVTSTGNVVSLGVPEHPVGVTATLTVRAIARTPGVTTNTVVASSAVNDPVATNNSASASLAVLEPLVDLSVTKTADRNSILLNETVTFTIQATNDGPTTATDVLVEDTLPAGLDLVSASADIGLISITGQTASLIVPAHPAGVTATLTVVARGSATGNLTNTATIASASEENSPGDESASAAVTVSQASADLSVATSISTLSPPLDSPVTFVATMTNNGPQTASNAVASVTVPSGYVLQSVTASTGLLVSASAFSHAVTIPNFASGGTLTVTVVATAQVTSASTFSASISSSTPDGNTGNNSGSRTPIADPTMTMQQSNGFEAQLGVGEIASLGQQIPGVIGTFHSSQVGSGAGVYTAAILPGARLYNSTGFVSEGAASLPYSAVGPNRIVRGKFSVYQTPLTTVLGPRAAPGTDPSRIPALRLRLANRFAVSSMLEVNSHIESDPGIAAYAAEITPSASPSNPSLYRVDLDPMDVPYLVANGATERIRYGFEALKNSLVTQGSLNLTEVSLGTYSIHATTNTVAPIATYSPDSLGAGQLAQSLSGAALSTLTFQVTTAGEVINFNTPGNPVPLYSEGTFGVTLDTRNVPAGTVGAIAREFAPGDFPSRPRVQEGRQYQVRMNLSSIQSVLNQSEIRLRARTVGFAYTQFLVVGGAWAIGTDPLAGNAALANQSLPGFGTQNPDRRAGQTTGGWYNLIIHSPLNVDIRPDIAGTLGEKMPLLSGQPGPGSSGGSFRDLRVALDLIDGSSQGPNAGLEQGQVTLDRIEIREWNSVPDHLFVDSD